ncbi:MAG: hypothetical protein LLG20_11380, partial [Acidobacteriales bacterium]|nr:hypothetical protein [Terriglobales bacterium]
MEAKKRNTRRKSMTGASPNLILLLIIWAGITVVFIGLLIWKNFTGVLEEDQLFLDPVAQEQEKEQRRLITKVQRITAWAKGFGVASVALLLIIAGIWMYQ